MTKYLRLRNTLCVTNIFYILFMLQQNYRINIEVEINACVVIINEKRQKYFINVLIATNINNERDQ